MYRVYYFPTEKGIELALTLGGVFLVMLIVRAIVKHYIRIGREIPPCAGRLLKETLPPPPKPQHEMKKYLFLDIDGVLNHQKFYEERYKRMKAGEKMVHPDCELDPECVKRVDRIVRETGCKLVISSSWRNDPKLKDVLKRMGLTVDHYDVTPYHASRIRGKEIALYLWMNNCFPARFAILDDDMDMLDWQMPYLVHTDSLGSGLDDSAMQAVLDILNAETSDGSL